MRVRPLLVAGSLLPGAAVLAAPAQAASPSLTVSAVGRDGRPVAIVATVVDVKSGREHDVRSGREKKLAAGSYSVTAGIRSADGTFTLASRVVGLKAKTKVAFDARKGRRVSFGVDDPSAELRTLQLMPFVKAGAGRQWALQGISDNVPAGGSYLIPVKSPRLSLKVYAHLERKGSTPERPSPYRYDLVGGYQGGLPSDTSWTSRRSRLKKVPVTIRSSAEGESGVLSRRPGDDNVGYLPVFGNTTEFASLPASIVVHQTPGYRWRTSVTGADQAGDGGPSTHPVKVNGREHYRTASWGPLVVADTEGRRLTVRVRPLAALGGRGSLKAESSRTRLYRGSTLVGQSAGGAIEAQIPASTSWYTLKLDARRADPDALSAKVWASWKFKAKGATHPGTRLFDAAFVPSGLDSRNAAARGSATPVLLHLGGGYKMKSVKVERSFDGGRTWKRVSLGRSGGGYRFKVANPGAAGFVSLRVTATATTGTSLSQTVLNAYKIG